MYYFTQIISYCVCENHGLLTVVNRELETIALVHRNHARIALLITKMAT